MKYLAILCSILQNIGMDNFFEETLLPRRAEILATIRDHEMVTFDQIRRRFLAVSPRTIHNDLQDLIRKKINQKIRRYSRCGLCSKINLFEVILPVDFF